MNNPAYRNPDPIFPPQSIWREISLGGGYAGILLLFSELQQKGLLRESQESSIHQFILRIKEVIERDGLNSLSLFSGVSGICFAIQQASFNGNRYQKMLRTLQDFLFRNIEKAYFAPLQEDIKLGRSSSSSLHDVIQGLSGIGRYALENLSNPRLHELAEKIISHLIERIRPYMFNGYKIPGWYLAPEDPLHQGSLSSVKLNFNLGLAHGVTGILALFSIALRKGVKIQGQVEAMKQMANWICSKSFVKNGIIQWPDAVTWEEQIGKKKPRKEARKRPAWCYGSLGISRTLLLAAKSLNDQPLKDFALKAFHQIFLFDRTSWEIVSPSICHGMAGFLLLTNEMVGEDKSFSIQRDMLKKSLLQFYNPNSPFGFNNVQHTKTGTVVQVSDPGFLEGTAGILLTLLHLESPSSSWHLPLLIE